MQKAFLEKLKQKPQPKTKEEYAIVFKPSSKEDVAIKMTIVDERSKHDIDMANLLSKMKTRVNVSVPTQSKPAASTKQMPTKSIKGKKIKLVDAFTKQVPGPTAVGDTVAKKYRITKAPDQSVIFEADSDVVIKPEFIQRLPVEKEKVLVKSSTYYMNNRETFVNFINSLFEPYKDELKKAESERDSSSSTERDLFTHQKIVRDYLNLYTPYRGLLLYHGLGSGKTCSSIAIAEGMKSGKNVLIMTPAALRMNYIEQLNYFTEVLIQIIL